MDNIEQAELNTFHNNFESEVKLMSSPTKFGSIKIFEIELPSKYNKLCLVNSRLINNPPEYDENIPADERLDPLIIDSLRSGNNELAFLFGKSFQLYSVGNISIYDYEKNRAWDCGTPTAGIIKLKLKGKGNGVQVTFEK